MTRRRLNNNNFIRSVRRTSYMNCCKDDCFSPARIYLPTRGNVGKITSRGTGKGFGRRSVRKEEIIEATDDSETLFVSIFADFMDMMQ